MSKTSKKTVTSRLKPNKPKTTTKPSSRKPSATKPKADKKSKTKADPAPAKTTSAAPTTISTQIDPQQQRLAIAHRDALAVLQKRQRDLSKDFRLLGKAVKSDGFTMKGIKIMIDVATPEGEQALRLSMANDLIMARYAGAAVGEQLSLFLEPDRTPAVDRAYQEGRRASIEGKSLKPPYDPSTPQYESFTKGWHDETGERTRAGIKMPKEEDAEAKSGSAVIPKAETDAKVKEAADRAAARAAGNAPPTGKTDAVTSRQAFKDQQAAAAAARTDAEAHFRKPAAGTA